MYLPPSFAEHDPVVIEEFVLAHPLGLLISQSGSDIEVTPAPFAYTGTSLLTHLSRANAHWKALLEQSQCTVVFQGLDAYVTPNWYASKKTTHQTVPTWNYEVVQFTGIATVHEEPDWLSNQINQITNQMEQPREDSWKVSDAPDDFVSKQIKAIVGIEIKILETVGKWKMSQNRNDADVSGVVNGMSDPADYHHNLAVSEIVKARNSRISEAD